MKDFQDFEDLTARYRRWWQHAGRVTGGILGGATGMAFVKTARDHSPRAIWHSRKVFNTFKGTGGGVGFVLGHKAGTKIGNYHANRKIKKLLKSRNIKEAVSISPDKVVKNVYFNIRRFKKYNQYAQQQQDPKKQQNVVTFTGVEKIKPNNRVSESRLEKMRFPHQRYIKMKHAMAASDVYSSLDKETRDKIIYGRLRKLGWKPRRERRMEK